MSDPQHRVSLSEAEALRPQLRRDAVCESGDDHEETLAHLAALAVHLENAGKPEEAAEFQREHDEIAARVGKKTAGS